MSSRASGWASGQTRRCRGSRGDARAGKRARTGGAKIAFTRANGPQPPWGLAFTLYLQGVQKALFASSKKRLLDLRELVFKDKQTRTAAETHKPCLLTPHTREVDRKRSRVARIWFSGLPAASISVAPCRGFGVERGSKCKYTVPTFTGPCV
jgi:hypothetical protein